LEIVEEICERFLFVQSGSVTPLADYASLLAHEPASTYLAELLYGRSR
jgi:hypothetical protein